MTSSCPLLQDLLEKSRILWFMMQHPYTLWGKDKGIYIVKKNDHIDRASQIGDILGRKTLQFGIFSHALIQNHNLRALELSWLEGFSALNSPFWLELIEEEKTYLQPIHVSQRSQKPKGDPLMKKKIFFSKMFLHFNQIRLKRSEILCWF